MSGRCDHDLDGLVLGELSHSEEELTVREHLRGCSACRAEHEALLLEHRAFAARAHAGRAARARTTALPDFNLLLARAEAEPVGLELRWQRAARTWSALFRGTFSRAVLAVAAVGLVVHVAWPDRPGAEPATASGASFVTSAALPLAASQGGPQSLPLEDANDSEACDGAGEVCVDQLFASGATATMTPVLRANMSTDVCTGATNQSIYTPVDWSPQKSSSNELDLLVEAVCSSPDAI